VQRTRRQELTVFSSLRSLCSLWLIHYWLRLVALGVLRIFGAIQSRRLPASALLFPLRENKGCRLAAGHYTGTVKSGSAVKIIVMISAVLVIGTGCGGFYAAPAVSPLMFLLPGLAQTKPGLPPPPVPGQTQTNQTVAQAY